MACNCATNEQLNKLYEQFGQKQTVSKNTTFSLKIKNIFTKIGVSICLIFVFPYVLFYIFKHGILGDGKISLAHFFGFREKIVNK